MKKIYIFLLFTVSFAGLYGQTFINRALNHYNDQATSLVRINNKSYFSSIVYTPYADTTMVTGIDANGQVLFRRSIIKNAYTGITKMIRTLDNQIALIGSANQCDFIDNSSKTFFMKINASFGFTLIDRSLQPDGNSDNFRDLVQYSDSSYFVITDSILFHFSKTGQQYTRRNTGLTGLASINVNSNGKLVLATNHPFSTNTVYVTDTSAVLISQQVLNGISDKTVLKNLSSLYTLNKTIQKRNASMQIMASSAMSQDSLLGNVITDFVLHNDTIYACGYNISGNPYTSFTLRMDSSLHIMGMNFNFTKGVRPEGIVHDTKTTLLLNSQSMPTATSLQGLPVSNGITGIYSMPDNGIYSFTKDVGVTRIWLDSGYIVPYVGWYPPSGPAYYQLTDRYYKVKVTVKNFGFSPVENLQINHFLNVNVGCSYHVFDTANFSNLHLNPGDTLVFDLGWKHSQALNTPSTGPVPSSAPINVCFHTSVPDHEHDTDRDNDGLCTSLMLPVTVGLKEKKAEAVYLNIYPNPANDLLNIHTDAFIETISISDITGRTIRNVAIGKTNQCEISLADLESGIYFISTYTDKGMAIRKVIKK
ncbi:MAG: C-terminal target protein [Bacteroidetes bacterium]|jgi:hypothetical protein|nr:C-terminal target protein [Bacteroidota bacterium]